MDVVSDGEYGLTEVLVTGQDEGDEGVVDNAQREV